MWSQWMKKKEKEKKSRLIQKLLKKTDIKTLYERSIIELDLMRKEAEETLFSQYPYDIYKQIRYNFSEAFIIETKDDIECKLYGESYDNQLEIQLDRQNLEFFMFFRIGNKEFYYDGLLSELNELGEKMIEFERVAWCYCRDQALEEYRKKTEAKKLLITILEKRPSLVSFMSNLEKIQNQIERYDLITAHNIRRMTAEEIPALLHLYQLEGENEENVLQGFEMLNQQIEAWMPEKKFHENPEWYLKLLEVRYGKHL